MYEDFDMKECRKITMIDDNFSPETAEVVHRYCAACPWMPEEPSLLPLDFCLFRSLTGCVDLVIPMYKNMGKACNVSLGPTAERALAQLALSEIVAHCRACFEPLRDLFGENEAGIIFGGKHKPVVLKRCIHGYRYAAIMIAALAFESFLQKHGAGAENMAVEDIKSVLKANLDRMNIDVDMHVFSQIYRLCHEAGFYTGMEHMPAD